MPRMTSEELRAYECRRYATDRELRIIAGEDDTPESKIQDQIEAECRRRGWYVVRSRMDRPTTNAVGTPDLIIARDAGRVLWVECKRPGRKLTEEQAGARAWLSKLGHLHFVAHSLVDFVEVLESI